MMASATEIAKRLGIERASVYRALVGLGLVFAGQKVAFCCHGNPAHERTAPGSELNIGTTEQAEETPHGTAPKASRRVHAQAHKCQRLASESLDPFVREALIELASDYEHLADRLERQRAAREGPRRRVAITSPAQIPQGLSLPPIDVAGPSYSRDQKIHASGGNRSRPERD
jgi:hypothetical protein